MGANGALPSGIAYLSIPTAATQVLAANAARQFIEIRNTSATYVYLGFGLNPSTGLSHKVLGPSGASDSVWTSSVYTGAVNAVTPGVAIASIPYYEFQ